jgi:hypothetical protein
MPLDKSGSKASVGANIKVEQAAGKPHQQAVAIALSVQRQAKGEPARAPHPASGHTNVRNPAAHERKLRHG